MKPEERFKINEADIVPALRAAASLKGLKVEKLGVALPVQNGQWVGQGRHRVLVSDATQIVEWRVNTLSELYRGKVQPPPNLDRFPPEYVPLFYFVERHMITFCDGLGDKSDQEFEEVYSNLRRRPEGRSLGPLHEFAWQVAAVMLGTRVISAAEFDGVIGALAASARRWAQRPISRNYIGYLRQNTGRH
jgi:hypothetical protein